MLCKKR
jgi:hypothetical protein